MLELQWLKRFLAQNRRSENPLEQLRHEIACPDQEEDVQTLLEMGMMEEAEAKEEENRNVAHSDNEHDEDPFELNGVGEDQKNNGAEGKMAALLKELEFDVKGVCVCVTGSSIFFNVLLEQKPRSQMRRFNQKMSHAKFQVDRMPLDKRGGLTLFFTLMHENHFFFVGDPSLTTHGPLTSLSTGPLTH